MALSTAVVLFVFNRPALARQVFQQIRKAEPSTLYIVADGPRTEQERDLCQAAREIVALVDWDCEIETHFSDTNLGLPQRIVTGLDRVFSRFDEAIILEDDCLPSMSFFRFCEDLLSRYRDDRRIMEIGGINLQLGRSRTSDSYYFSKYTHSWGWATWSRAWAHFDVNISAWPDVKDRDRFDEIFDDSLEKEYWTWMFDKVYWGGVRSWMFPWLFGMWQQRALSIVPDVNLISNIGYGPDATHTTKEDPYSRLPVHELGELTHPEVVVRHREADRYEFEHAFATTAWRSPLGRLRRQIGSIRDRILPRLSRNGG